MKKRILKGLFWILPIANYGQKVQFEDYWLPKDTVISYQTSVEHRTYTFPNDDSTHLSLAQTIKCDEKGNEIEIIWTGFQDYVDAKTVHKFDSQGHLIMRFYQTNLSFRPPLVIQLSLYDSNQRLKQTIDYAYSKRRRKQLNPETDTSTSNEKEPFKLWKVHTLWKYEYDDKGRLLKKYAPIFDSSQDLYTYKYDDQNRIIEQASFNQERGLIWIQKHTYFNKDSSEFIRLWYSEGNRDTSYNGKWTQDFVWKQKYDSFGNLIEERIIERESGIQHSRERKWYDVKNRIVRHEIYDDFDQKKRTDIYKYDVKKGIEKNTFIIQK